MAPDPSVPGTRKRKDAPGTKAEASRSRKRQKAYNVRNIPVQSAQAVPSAAGELNVAKFIQAREFEISALNKGMKSSRQGLMTRAFQQVPRNMRRRTASHNVKKVPKRLRKRAEREMKEDNTPTVVSRRRTPTRKLRLRLETAKLIQSWSKRAKSVRQKKREAKHRNGKQKDPPTHVDISRAPRIRKNTLAKPPLATSKFKRRQVHKAWLPTHLWHAKRAHMTKPTEPLWRMAIPLSPTDKVYRSTHRASGARGCVAWDTSYMSTIGCRGTAEALEGFLRALNFSGESWKGLQYQKWKRGRRTANGWLSERDNHRRLITPVTVLWAGASPHQITKADQMGSNTEGLQSDNHPKKNRTRQRLQSRLLIRLHPSAFHQLWLELCKVAKMQRPQVLLEDLRFEIGSIQVTGPESTQSLVSVLKPLQSDDDTTLTKKTWESLFHLTNPSSLPRNCMIGFNVVDPRLHSRPAQDKLKERSAVPDLTEVMVDWPPDHHDIALDIFSHQKRYRATKAMRSQKYIMRRRRRSETTQGQVCAAETGDPHIPVLLYASRESKGNAQGSWSALMPWKCIDAVWRSLVYCPLANGGEPRFGGLNETRQIHFELCKPWFPGDFPGTEAGKVWERTETEKRFDEWLRKPDGKRIAWDKLELGNGQKGELGLGWACDWEYLMTENGPPTSANPEPEVSGSPRLPSPSQTSGKPLTQRQRKAAKAQNEQMSRRRNTSSPESDVDVMDKPLESELSRPVLYSQMEPSAAVVAIEKPIEYLSPFPLLASVRISLLVRGTPVPCARIYRLPGEATGSALARGQWLSTLTTPDKLTVPSTSKHDNHPSKRLPKQKKNHRGLPKHHTVYPPESLESINYMPADAPPEVVNDPEFQPKPRGSTPTAQQQIRHEKALMEKLMNPDLAENSSKSASRSHPPCPGKEDLIGFVTTGGYNLAEGRGTAIGAVWVQRVIQGWTMEKGRTQIDAESEDGIGVSSSRPSGNGKVTEKEIKRKDWERRLCIVRNAGENVGRLAIWEICT